MPVLIDPYGPAILQNYQEKIESLIFITKPEDFGTIDSTKTYYIDGVVDMGSTSLEVPAGGINIIGSTFDVSQLISSEDNYTMFTSPGGGSGNILVRNVGLTASGTSSQLFDLVSATGFDAFEFNVVNFNNCSSLGTIDNYRQGLETGTGRFGGQCQLTLSGNWLGGYFIDTSIVRGLTDGSYSLYKAGAGFSMNSRFRSNQNIDLPANVSFFDFEKTQFPNPNTVQLDGCIISRNGSFDATDANIIPNFDKGAEQAYWKNNVGIQNTYVGGRATLSTEVTTTISTAATFVDLAGTWINTDLQHFDSPSNGQLRHLGINPIEFNIIADLMIESNANNEVEIRIRKWDDANSVFVDFGNQARQVNSFVGGRDVGFFTILESVILNQNDYLFLQIANNSNTNNVTCELDSFFTVSER